MIKLHRENLIDTEAPFPLTKRSANGCSEHAAKQSECGSESEGSEECVRVLTNTSSVSIFCASG